MQKAIKNVIRGWFARFAGWFDRVTHSRISATDITWVGFLAHLPIAYLIAQDQLLTAGLLLTFFGLFDTLDGALARVQKTASPRGMFLDASSDRLKEVILYTGFSVYFATFGPDWAMIATLMACGLSLSVSYIKAKGEAALAVMEHALTHDKLNRIFDDGIGSFETRMLILVIGCIFGIPAICVSIVALIAGYTLVVRYLRIQKALIAHA
jgi:phosphatidylglycerophosphate synthase